MNTALTPESWLSAVGRLAFELAMLLGITGVVHCFLTRPFTRRVAWIVGSLGCALLLLANLSGYDRTLSTTALAPRSRVVSVEVHGKLPNPKGERSDFVPKPVPEASTAVEAVSLIPDSGARKAIFWPAWLWLCGTAVVAGWLLLPRLWLATVFRRNSQHVGDSALQRVRHLAQRLGVNPSVQLFVSEKLASPIAFGVFRPGIGLPVDFWSDYSTSAQDAMLVHELAHLKVKDPLVLAGLDVLLALLWWHPMIWWARKEFRAASEATADEASLLVENGPESLAKCLVELASRWRGSGMLGLLGMAGFRSGLGKRVERLLSLEPEPRPVLVFGRAKTISACALSAGIAFSVMLTAARIPGFAASELSSLGSIISSALNQSPNPTASPGIPLPAQPVLRSDPEPKALVESSNSAPAQAKAETPSPQESPTRFLSASPDSNSNLVVSRPLPEPQTNELRSPTGTPSLKLMTRTFFLSSQNLNAALEAILGSPTLKVATTNLTDRLRDAIKAAGVPIDDSASGRALFYNDKSGQLFVRATGEEQDLIEHFLTVLNSAPPQVVMEAMFVEIAEPDLGGTHDWLKIPATTEPGTNGVKYAELRKDPQFLSVIAALNRTGSATNNVQQLGGDKLNWAGRNATNAANIQVEQGSDATIGGILNKTQFRAILDLLQKRSGVTVLAAPKVLTLSGRPAQIQVSEMLSVVTGLNPAALQKPLAGSTTNVLTFTTAQIPVGPVVDLVPFVRSNGTEIEMIAMPSITEFLGYQATPKPVKQKVWINGKAQKVDVPLPRFRVRQMTGKSILPDGYTLVLGSFPVQETVRTKDKIPVLGDVPLLGRLFRNEGSHVIKKSLIVFVTPTIVDPAGNARARD